MGSWHARDTAKWLEYLSVTSHKNDFWPIVIRVRLNPKRVYLLCCTSCVKQMRFKEEYDCAILAQNFFWFLCLTPRCSSHVKLTRDSLKSRNPRITPGRYVRPLDIGPQIHRKKRIRHQFEKKRTNLVSRKILLTSILMHKSQTGSN